jgi:uncharacterized membrane protein
MDEKLLWIATITVIGLSLYGFWLISPEKFIYALVIYTLVIFFFLGTADTQKETRHTVQLQKEKHCTVQRKNVNLVYR